MTKLRNYFLDFSNILIETYSETGLAPARANINIIKIKSVEIIKIKTVYWYSLLQNFY